MKTETQTPHPHEFIADFVNKYEGLIKPNLKEGNLDVTPVIMDVCMRREILDGLKVPIKGTIYAKYTMALGYLGGLLREENIGRELLEIVVLSVGRFVSELDLALEDDVYYKSQRRKI